MPDITKIVAKMLALLREKIDEQGFTQLRIQEELHWGPGFVCRLLKKKKNVPVDVVLQILYAIGVEPGPFIAEAFRAEAPETAPVKETVEERIAGLAASVLETRRELEVFQQSHRGLVRHLVEDKLIPANHAEAILAGLAGYGGG